VRTASWVWIVRRADPKIHRLWPVGICRFGEANEETSVVPRSGAGQTSAFSCANAGNSEEHRGVAVFLGRGPTGACVVECDRGSKVTHSDEFALRTNGGSLAWTAVQAASSTQAACLPLEILRRTETLQLLIHSIALLRRLRARPWC
jgi:hypothetical protein